MQCRLVKINELSGKAASIYSVVIDDEDETLLDQFIREYSVSFIDETKDILKRLKTIGYKTGARVHFFKEQEGNPGDGVCALYDQPHSHLRLYCIRYGTQLVLAGSGGHKPKTIRAFQDDERLAEANYFLRWLSGRITERIKDKEIRYINDGLDFVGDLTFNTEDE
jgi:hypothetical protein